MVTPVGPNYKRCSCGENCGIENDERTCDGQVKMTDEYDSGDPFGWEEIHRCEVHKEED
jgi:hypothetical protein